ncbi:MAG: hypothetical protein JST39_18540, partial [Bacteroidetes bacterium]|nr:hypothetical protein [Bacteroidota bacterium]
MKTTTMRWLPLLLLFCGTATAQPLMDKITTEVSNVKMYKYAEIKTWSFTLPNGVVLVMRPDDSAKNVLINGFAQGGAAGLPASEYAAALHAGGIIKNSGLDRFDGPTLSAMMRDKNIQLSAGIGENGSFISGFCEKEDLEMALQLIYLYFTAPRRDADACRQYIQKLKDMAAKHNSSVLEDTVNAIRYRGDIRRLRSMSKETEDISMEKVFAAWDKCFGNARGFTFVITGNLNPNSMNHSRLEPMADRYLAALPSQASAERPAMEGIPVAAATVEKTIYAGSDSLASASVIFSGNYKYSDSANLQLKALAWILRQRWLDDLHGDGFRISGMNTSSRMEKLPQSRYELRINFVCPVAQGPRLLSLLHAVTDSMQTDIPEEYLKRFVDMSKKSLREQQGSNSY